MTHQEFQFESYRKSELRRSTFHQSNLWLTTKTWNSSSKMNWQTRIGISGWNHEPETFWVFLFSPTVQKLTLLLSNSHVSVCYALWWTGDVSTTHSSSCALTAGDGHHSFHNPAMTTIHIGYGWITCLGTWSLPFLHASIWFLFKSDPCL